jgi:hypothetical protein
MSKIHIIVKTTLLPPILLVVQIIPHLSQAQHPAEEYFVEYMVNEKASLKQALPSLLAALDQIIVHHSKAEDTGSTIQTGIHLAQRTLNTFSGSHQWSMPLMASALLGNKLIISSELFHYLFPHANVSYVNSLLQFHSNL